MAGIISDVSSDIKKLQSVKNEIEEVKKSLKSIDIRVNLDIKENLEAQLKSLMAQYDMLVQRIGEAEGKIILSIKRINDATEKIVKAQDRLSSASQGASATSSDNIVSDISLETDGVKAQAKAYDELRIAIEEIDGVRSNNITRMLREQEQMKSYQKELKELEKAPKTNDSNKRFVELTESIERSKIAIAELRQAVRKDIKLEMAAPGSVDALSQSLSRMKDVWKGLSPEELESPFGKELTASIQQADDKIKELSGTIGEHQRKVGQYENATKKLRTEQRDLIEEIAILTLQYRTMSDAEKRSGTGRELEQKITNLTNKAAQLKDAMADVNRAVNVRASDTSNFNSISEGINLIVSGFGAATGAAKLLGLSEEDLLEVQTKLQAAYVASSAITKIQNSLQKESALMRGIEVLQTKAATTAINIKTSAEGRGVIVTKAATVAQSALNAVAKANPYVLLASAILSVVGALWAFSKGQSEVKKQVEDFNNYIADAASKPITKIEELSIKWNRLGDDLKAKEAFVRDNQKAFQELGVAVFDVLEAENLLNNNKEAFIKSQIEKAKAVAYLSTAQDKIKELIKAEEEYKSMPEKASMYVQPMGADIGYYKEVINPKKVEKKVEIDKLNAEITNLYNSAASAEQEGSKKLEDASISAMEKYEEGSTKAINKAIAEKREQLSRLTIGSSEYNKLDQEIKELQKRLSSDDSTSNLNALSSQEDKIFQLRQKHALDRKRQAEDLEYQAAQARIDAMADGSEKVQAQMRLDHQKEIQEIQRQKQNYIRVRIQEAKEIFDAEEELRAKENKDYKKKTFDASTVTVDTSIFDEITKTTIERQGNDLAEYYKEVLSQYQDYATKRLEAKKKFDADLKKLEKAGGTEGQKAELEYQREETYKAIDKEFAMREDSFQSWADGIANMALEELQRLLVNTERELERMSFANKQGVSNDQGLAEQRAKVTALREQISDVNNKNKTSPDKRSIKDWQDLYKTLSKVEKEFEEVGDAIGGTIGEVISAAGSVTASTLSMIDSIVSLGTISADNIKGVSKATAQAISTVEKASVILAIVSAALQIATKIVSFFKQDDGIAAYEKAKDTYDSYIQILDKVIDKQLELAETLSGENAKAAYREAINLIQQQSDAAKEMGKAYLNSGASKGVFGIGSKASRGRKEVEDMSVEGWLQAAKALGMSVEQFKEIMGGRMTGLFDLTEEQLVNLQKYAPSFWAQLDDDTRNYANQIVDGVEQIMEVLEQEMENATGVSWDSFTSDILDSLYDVEKGAEDIADDIADYMRKALIKSMYVKQYEPEMRKWYEKWAEYTEDGILSDTEQSELDRLKDGIIQGATESAKLINEQWAAASTTQQQATAGGYETMSQDTATELNGRFAALQVAGEEIKNQTILSNEWLSKIYYAISSSYNLPDIAGEARNVAVNSNNSQLNIVFPETQINTLSDEVSGLRVVIDEMRDWQAMGWQNIDEMTNNVGKIAKTTPDVVNSLKTIKDNSKNW